MEDIPLHNDVALLQSDDSNEVRETTAGTHGTTDTGRQTADPFFEPDDDRLFAAGGLGDPDDFLGLVSVTGPEQLGSAGRNGDDTDTGNAEQTVLWFVSRGTQCSPNRFFGIEAELTHLSPAGVTRPPKASGPSIGDEVLVYAMPLATFNARNTVVELDDDDDDDDDDDAGNGDAAGEEGLSHRAFSPSPYQPHSHHGRKSKHSGSRHSRQRQPHVSASPFRPSPPAGDRRAAAVAPADRRDGRLEGEEGSPLQRERTACAAPDDDIRLAPPPSLSQHRLSTPTTDSKHRRKFTAKPTSGYPSSFDGVSPPHARGGSVSSPVASDASSGGASSSSAPLLTAEAPVVIRLGGGHYQDKAVALQAGRQHQDRCVIDRHHKDKLTLTEISFKSPFLTKALVSPTLPPRASSPFGRRRVSALPGGGTLSTLDAGGAGERNALFQDDAAAGGTALSTARSASFKVNPGDGAAAKDGTPTNIAAAGIKPAKPGSSGVNTRKVGGLAAPTRGGRPPQAPPAARSLPRSSLSVAVAKGAARRRASLSDPSATGAATTNDTTGAASSQGGPTRGTAPAFQYVEGLGLVRIQEEYWPRQQPHPQPHASLSRSDTPTNDGSASGLPDLRLLGNGLTVSDAAGGLSAASPRGGLRTTGSVGMLDPSLEGAPLGSSRRLSRGDANAPPTPSSGASGMLRASTDGPLLATQHSSEHNNNGGEVMLLVDPFQTEARVLPAKGGSALSVSASQGVDRAGGGNGGSGAKLGAAMDHRRVSHVVSTMSGSQYSSFEKRHPSGGPQFKLLDGSPLSGASYSQAVGSEDEPSSLRSQLSFVGSRGVTHAQADDHSPAGYGSEGGTGGNQYLTVTQVQRVRERAVREAVLLKKFALQEREPWRVKESSSMLSSAAANNSGATLPNIQNGPVAGAPNALVRTGTGTGATFRRLSTRYALDSAALNSSMVSTSTSGALLSQGNATRGGGGPTVSQDGSSTKPPPLTSRQLAKLAEMERDRQVAQLLPDFPLTDERLKVGQAAAAARRNNNAPTALPLTTR